MAVRTYTKDQMDRQLSPHYKVRDFWSNSRYSKIKLDTQLVEILEQFGAHFGAFPRLRNRFVGTAKYEMVRSAGYRDPAIDWTGSKKSQHCFGKALDIEIPGVPAYRLAQFAETLPQIGGIGQYYVTAEPIDICEHIHIDVRSHLTPARWGHQNKTSGCNIPTFGGIPKTLKRGHQGCAVRLLQDFLNRWAEEWSLQKMQKLALDGDFGAKTVALLKRFQQENCLTPDGKYGRKTNEKTELFDW